MSTELFSQLKHETHTTTTVRYINNSTMILTVCQDHGRSIGRPHSYVLNEPEQRWVSGTRIDAKLDTLSDIVEVVEDSCKRRAPMFLSHLVTFVLPPLNKMNRRMAQPQ